MKQGGTTTNLQKWSTHIVNHLNGLEKVFYKEESTLKF